MEQPNLIGREALVNAMLRTTDNKPMSKEWWLRRRRRAKRSYSTFKVSRGGCEEIHLIQGKEQQLRFPGAAVKRYPMPKVRETQVRW